MLNKNILCIPWFKFSKLMNGERLYFRWEQLQKHRYEEFIDFKMNYYVKHEMTHVVAGIPKNPEAMDEYRQIVAKKIKSPSYYTAICCVDDETSGIVAFNSLNLYKKGEEYTDFIQAHTVEVKKFFQILHEWNKLCPVPEILDKYHVDKYMDDAGAAIHPKYSGYGITKEISLNRRLLCKANGVPLTGAWLTAVATQKTTKRDGWETVYEINFQELEKKLGITFENPPSTFKYSVQRIF